VKLNSIVVSKATLTSSLVEKNDIGVVKKIKDTEIEVYFIRVSSQVKMSISQVAIIDPSKFGDSFKEKICNVCHKIYPTTFFDLNQNGKDNRPIRRPSCKNCREDIDGVSMTSKDKKEWLKVKPVLIDFECPICTKITIAGLTSKVVLNHDHSNGKPSGWICDSCNTGLGRFKDDTRILKRAIDYLNESI